MHAMQFLSDTPTSPWTHNCAPCTLGGSGLIRKAEISDSRSPSWKIGQPCIKSFSCNGTAYKTIWNLCALCSLWHQLKSIGQVSTYFWLYSVRSHMKDTFRVWPRFYRDRYSCAFKGTSICSLKLDFRALFLSCVLITLFRLTPLIYLLLVCIPAQTSCLTCQHILLQHVCDTHSSHEVSVFKSGFPGVTRSTKPWFWTDKRTSLRAHNAQAFPPQLALTSEQCRLCKLSSKPEG